MSTPNSVSEALLSLRPNSLLLEQQVDTLLDVMQSDPVYAAITERVLFDETLKGDSNPDVCREHYLTQLKELLNEVFKLGVRFHYPDGSFLEAITTTGTYFLDSSQPEGSSVTHGGLSYYTPDYEEAIGHYHNSNNLEYFPANRPMFLLEAFVKRHGQAEVWQATGQGWPLAYIYEKQEFPI